MTEIVEFNVENVKTQMRKGILEFPILLIVAGNEKYAAEILEELKRADLIVVDGTLYPILNRLKRSGLLDSKLVESKEGPARKYYSLTKKGSDVLVELVNVWGVLHKSIQALLKKYEKSN